MGSVHAAHDERLNRKVAIKLLKDGLAEDERFIERFKREARAAAALSHPNIAGVYDYGEDGRCSFIVMELVEGQDLSRTLRQEGSLEPERARRIVAQIASALGFAHANGLVHRDVKPGNVILGPNDVVKVTDFGIARASGDSTLTATGSVLGTAQYLAPEQASGGEVSSATDVYALGIVLYEMLTGAVPFTGDSAVAVAMRHMSDEVPAPSELKPSVPPDLDAVVKRATEKDPAMRFANGESFAAALSGAPTEGAETASATTRLWGASESGRRARGLTQIVVFCLAALLLVATALAVVRALSSEDPEEQRAVEQEESDEAAGADNPSPAPFVLPADLSGYSYADIERAIEGSGLDIQLQKNEIDSGAPKDSVLASSPEPGSEVHSGETITLTVSSGKTDVEDAEDDDVDRDKAPGKGRGKGKGKGKGDD
jgi:serine/threonine-protein kinase